MNDHPVWDYFDYRRAAISVLQDYATQAIILSQGDSHAEEPQTSLTPSPRPRIDGLPRTVNPHAGEARVLDPDNLDVLKARSLKAQAYMDWSNPAWKDSAMMTGSSWRPSSTTCPQRTRPGKSRRAFPLYVERQRSKKQRACLRFARLLYGRD